MFDLARFFRWKWWKARFWDFRQGHSIGLAFILSFISFIVLNYSLFISEVAFLRNIFQHLWQFALLFIFTYIPLAILIGNYFFKKQQFPTDIEIGVRANPFLWKYQPGRELIFAPFSALNAKMLQRIALRWKLFETAEEKAQWQQYVDLLEFLAEGGDLRNFQQNNNNSNGMRVLDIGCGNHKDPRATIGIDIKHDSQADKIMDAHKLDFPTQHFDLVIMSQVLEHCQSPFQVLREVHRVLKKDGVLELSIPNRLFFWVFWRWWRQGAVYVDPTHLYAWTEPELKQLLTKAGFAVEKLQPVDIPRFHQRSRLRRLFSPRISSQEIMVIAHKKED